MSIGVSGWKSAAVVVLVGLFQSAGVVKAQQDRIASRIDRTQAVILRGHMQAIVRSEFDQGKVEPGFALPSITLRLKPSARQQSGLEQLLAQQQDPTSTHYHQWLTPEQYAGQFGVSEADIAKVTGWLKSSGFTVLDVARGRNFITFSGTAGQVQAALGTEIHRYKAKEEAHYSNAGEPSIPAALAEVVLGFRGLNNFRMKPHHRKESLNPMTTSGSVHHMAPDDLATIYNIDPLYQAGVDGTGQSLVVVGQTAIRTSDITSFRTHFNLPAINLQQVLVPRQANPGVRPGDLDEADLDIEWSGAVARNATIIYVYSGDVFTSLEHAVDQNLGPVISMSYGLCEGYDLIDLPAMQTTAQQANVQGITWLAASGDSGAADCEDPSASVSQSGLAVDVPASIPEVTGMGGTEFVDQGSSYWSPTNTANLASAQSYIPEKVWNDTSDGSLAAGGGGVSTLFAQPVWQTGPGVPNDGFRHVPDISMASSASHDGFYVATGNSFAYYGGTSVAAPTMAGILVLLNQYLVSTGAQGQPGLGNINPMLYRLAQNSPGVFHDVVSGDNAIPCNQGSADCGSSGSVGYSAGSNYDMASGLGSPDAYNLVHQWSSQSPQASAVVPSIDQNPVFKLSKTDANGHNWSFVLTFTEEAGIATTLNSLSMDGQNVDIAAFFGTTKIAARGTISSKNLGFATLTVPKNVVFAFSGVDASGQTWSQQYSIPFKDVQVHVAVGGASNAASGQQVYAPGMIMSVYGYEMGAVALSATATPLPSYLAGFEGDINGVNIPLYYVSPNQVNVQIPYEIGTGPATLTLGNPYQNATYRFQVTAAAPGIFVSNGLIAPPFASAKRGAITTLFITGDGQVRPGLTTGSGPAAGTATARLPKSILPVSLTVGGIAATIQFNGIPVGLVGVTQINFTVPSDAPLGSQPVVVTVGSASSPAVNLNVTQ